MARLTWDQLGWSGIGFFILGILNLVDLSEPSLVDLGLAGLVW